MTREQFESLSAGQRVRVRHPHNPPHFWLEHTVAAVHPVFEHAGHTWRAISYEIGPNQYAQAEVYPDERCEVIG